MGQTQNEIPQNLAERWCWQVARRDDTRVARRWCLLCLAFNLTRLHVL